MTWRLPRRSALLMLFKQSFKTETRTIMYLNLRSKCDKGEKEEREKKRRNYLLACTLK